MVEILAVMAISVILLAVVGLSIPGLLGSQHIDGAASDLQGLVELARSDAMAGNTYVWMGIFEENPTTPGTPGIGQLVVSIISSADGTQLYSGTTLPDSLPVASLTQLKKLSRINGVHLDEFSAAQLARSNIPGSVDEVGDGSFAPGMTFPFPLSGTPTYTFGKIIQFSPQGDVTRPGDNLTQDIEICLRPAHPGVADATSKNLLALQISGISGTVTLIRP